jgi:predicted small secreted protein
MGYKILRYNYGLTQSHIDGNFKVILNSTGTGVGVSTLKLTVNEDTTMALDGNGTFYTDAAGTLGASQIATITAGATRTFYLKVTSGSSNLIVFKGNRSLIQFNEWTSSTNAASMSGVLSLPSVMTYFLLSGSNTMSGVLSLSSVMTFFHLSGSNTMSGVLSLPSVMTYFLLGGPNTMSGVLSLPSVMTTFYLSGSNTIQTYTTQSFASNMQRVYLRSGTSTNLTAAMNDQLLIDLNTAGGTWNTDKQINLKGSRTSASDAAVAALITKTVSVTVN